MLDQMAITGPPSPDQPRARLEPNVIKIGRGSVAHLKKQESPATPITKVT
jgi:hypothetical protein